jgi:hypothetical protein
MKSSEINSHLSAEAFRGMKQLSAKVIRTSFSQGDPSLIVSRGRSFFSSKKFSE